jgi:hypothetical protein
MTDVELINKFMGMDFIDPDIAIYSSSWNWLMPVVMRINRNTDSHYNAIHIDARSVFMHYKTNRGRYNHEVYEIDPLNPINTLHTAVLDCLRNLENRNLI